MADGPRQRTNTFPPKGQQAAPPAPRPAASLERVDPRLYERKEELAAGGMGQTFTAVDRRLGRRVVLKELPLPTSDDRPGVRAKLRARLEQEARILGALEHPNIVTVYEAGQWTDGEPFYAMSLVRGKELSQVVEGIESLEQRLALLPSIIAVADAVAYAHHRGVIHRDLTPKNILVGDYGDVVIIDWGIAKVLDDSETSFRCAPDRADGMTAAGMGVPAYACPEQIGGKDPDERFDVYSLGATLHFVLSGAPPFVGDTLEGLLGKVLKGQHEPLPAGIPGELRAIVHKAMSLDPQARYGSVRSLADELRAFTTGGVVVAHRYSALEWTRKWVRRRRVALLVSVAAVVALAAVAGLGHFGARSREDQRQRHAAVAKKRQAEQAQLASERLRQQAEDASRQAGVAAQRADQKSLDARKQAATLQQALAATRKQRKRALLSRKKALALARQERELKSAAELAKQQAEAASAEASKARQRSLGLAQQARQAHKKALGLAVAAQKAAAQATTRARDAEAAQAKAQGQLTQAQQQATRSQQQLKLAVARADKLQQQQARDQAARAQCLKQRASEAKEAEQRLKQARQQEADATRRLAACQRRRPAPPEPREPPAKPAPRPPGPEDEHEQ